MRLGVHWIKRGTVYVAQNGLLCLLDDGHYHPTGMVSDKIPSLLLFADRLALHVARSVRWDSDYVALLDDELKEIAREIVRCDALDRVLIVFYHVTPRRYP